MSVSPLAYLALTDYFYSYTVGDFRVLLFLEMDTEDDYGLSWVRFEIPLPFGGW